MAPSKKAAPPDSRQQLLLTLFSKQPKSASPYTRGPVASAHVRFVSHATGPPPPLNPTSSTSPPASSIATSAKSVKESVKSAGAAIASAVQKGKQEVRCREEAKPINTRAWKTKPSFVKALSECRTESDLIDFYVKIHTSDRTPPSTPPGRRHGAFAHKLRQPDDPSPTQVPSDPLERRELFKKVFEGAIADVSDRINHPSYDEGHQSGFAPALRRHRFA
ncbi:hypothetical protein JCM10296v2_006283 [Rhodotorula toruloides]